MNSIYQTAMGSDFARLHPQIQKRFGFTSHDKIAAIGKGIMQKSGTARTTPFPSSTSAPGEESCSPNTEPISGSP